MKRTLRDVMVGAVTGVAWVLVGLSIASTVYAFDPGSFDDGESVWVIALYFGRAGFVAGVLCGALLMLADRHRSLRTLRHGRLAVWGALSGLTLPLIQVAPMAMLPFFVGLGALTGVGTLALARRGARLEPPVESAIALHELPGAAG